MSDAQDPLNEPWLRQRASYPSWVQDQVRWSDTDMAGHVNNLAFAAYCETGRALLVRRFLAHDAEQPALMVLAEMRLKFLGEANWPADIDIGTGVTAISNRSCRIGQALFDGERCIAVAESALVLIDERTRKSRALPAEVRSLLASYSVRRAEPQASRQ